MRKICIYNKSSDLDGQDEEKKNTAVLIESSSISLISCNKFLI